jgi:energy-coupling factor transporter transmembrane protein EcfT
VVSVAFLTCTPIEDIAYGLNRLGMPYVASFALSLAFRLTPLFLQAGQQIALAQRARGLDLDRGGPLRRLRGYLPILVPVLLGGLRRADQLAVALELRGFGRPGKRTALPDYRFTWRDGLALLGVAAATGLVWLLGGGTAAA